jgi:dTDP-4-dehydrorhamnose reductase
MRLVVLGASGLLGREVVREAVRRGHRVLALGGSRPPSVPPGVEAGCLPPGDLGALERLMLDRFPDAVVNAAALSDVGACERDPAGARLANVELPERAAQLAHHVGARLVHVSTDMVFDGQRGPYRSTDAPGPLNTYARTKLEGESAVMAAGRHGACVVRSTPILGNTPGGDRTPHERLFLEWREGKVSRLFAEEVRQPVAAPNLAAVCVELAERDNLSGIFHWGGRDAVTRLELGERIARRFGLDPAGLVASVTYADLPGLPPRPRDLSVELHPLAGKLRTQPQRLDEILAELEVPRGCEDWWRGRTGGEVVRKLEQGIDF